MANKVFPIGDPKSKKYTSHFMKYEDAMECVAALKATEYNVNSYAHAVELGKLVNKSLFNGKAIRRLLNQRVPGAKKGVKPGLAIYPAWHEGRISFVMVAVDEYGQDIKTYAVNFGQPCPPLCPKKPDGTE